MTDAALTAEGAFGAYVDQAAPAIDLAERGFIDHIAMNGAGWVTIQSLFLGEFLIGLIYISVGYLMFTWFEKLSLVDGQIETV